MQEIVKSLQRSSKTLNKIDKNLLSKLLIVSDEREEQDEENQENKKQQVRGPSIMEGVRNIASGIIGGLIKAVTSVIGLGFLGMAALGKEFPTVVENLLDSALSVFKGEQPPVDNTASYRQTYENFYDLMTAGPAAGGQLSETQMDDLREAVKQRESSGNYSAVNDKGFVGAYQFGAAALEDLGYIEQGASQQGNSVLTDPSVFTGKDGIDNLEAFLSNESIQDQAFEQYAQLNLDRLTRQGTLTEESTAKEIAGSLAAAHLLGAGGARDLSSADAYGTTGYEYFELGATAVNASETALPNLQPQPRSFENLQPESNLDPTRKTQTIIQPVIQTQVKEVPVATPSQPAPQGQSASIDLTDYYVRLNTFL